MLGGALLLVMLIRGNPASQGPQPHRLNGQHGDGLLAAGEPCALPYLAGPLSLGGLSQGQACLTRHSPHSGGPESRLGTQSSNCFCDLVASSSPGQWGPSFLPGLAAKGATPRDSRPCASHHGPLLTWRRLLPLRQHLRLADLQGLVCVVLNAGKDLLGTGSAQSQKAGLSWQGGGGQQETREWQRAGRGGGSRKHMGSRELEGGDL